MNFLHKYGTLIIGILRIAFIIAVPFFVAQTLSSHELENVEYAKYYEGIVYGLDCTQTGDYLFKYNTEDKTGRVKKVDDAIDMLVTDNGKVYVLQERDEEYKLLSWSRIGYMKTVARFDKIEGMQAKRIMQAGQDRFFVYYLNEAEDEVQRVGYNEEWKKIEKVSVFKTGGMDFTTARITENGNIYFISANCSVYAGVENKEPELVFDVTDGPEENTAYANYHFAQHYFNFTNIRSGKNYSISLDHADDTPEEIKATYKKAKSFNDYELHRVNYTGDTIKAGSLYVDGGRKVAAVCGETEAVADTIVWGRLQYFVTVILTAAVIVLLYLLFRKKIQKLEADMFRNDATILLSATVILMIASLIAGSFVVIRYMNTEQEIQVTADIEELASRTVEELKKTDTEKLLKNGQAVLDNIYGEGTTLIILAELNEDDFYLLTEDANTEVPVSMYDPGLNVDVAETMKRAISTGQEASCLVQDNKINYSGIAVPVEDIPERELVIYIALPLLGFWEEFLSEFIVITIVDVLMLLAIFTVILMLLRKLGRQLASLNDASARVLEGELGAQADDRGINEVAAAIRVFNRLSAKLKDEEDAIVNCEVITKAFTPAGLMNQIRGNFEDVKVELGEETEGRAQILGLFIEGLNVNSTLTEKEFSNELISRFVNALSALNGSILDVGFNYLRYVDADMKSDVFHTVVPIIREINTEGLYKVRAVLQTTDIKAKIVGTSECMILDVYEKYDQGAEDIYRQAVEKGISLMVTEQSALIAGMSRYHFREAGIFHMTNSGKESILYEALDACTHSDSISRWNTRTVFEDGLEKLYVGQVEEARRAMAEVLIKDNNDSVAKYYIKQCYTL